MTVKFTKEQERLIEALNESNDGKWIAYYNGSIACNKCHTWFHKDDRYYYMLHCPYCGSRMNFETESEDEK